MIELLATGAMATLQDLGRPGYQQLGVGRSGAADRASHRLANRLVGNDERAATLELTLGGARLRLLTAATIALTGARCPGAPDWNAAVSLPAGSTIALGAPRDGLRSYLAVRGGFDAVPVLGSRSTDTLAGLGPAPVAAGDLLPVGTAVDCDPADPVTVRPAAGAIPVVFGPRADWFTDAGRLLSSSWTVRSDSDRIGIRLTGSPLARVAGRRGELATEPTLPGAIQVPPDGQPIVLFRDAPVTGGYPVIAVVAAAALDRFAQLRPGQSVAFRTRAAREVTGR